MAFRKLSVFHVLIVLFLISNFDRAYGIPAFARKYNKSCQTCHVSEPKLNAFGERFRANGYQLPGTIEDTPPWALKNVPLAAMLHEMFITRIIRNDMAGGVPPPRYSSR